VSTYIVCSYPQSVALDSINILCLLTYSVCRPRQCQHTLPVDTLILSPYTSSTYIVCWRLPSDTLDSVNIHFVDTLSLSPYTLSTYNLLTPSVCRPTQCQHTICWHPQSVALHNVNLHCLLTPSVRRLRECQHKQLVDQARRRKLYKNMTGCLITGFMSGASKHILKNDKPILFRLFIIPESDSRS